MKKILTIVICLIIVGVFFTNVFADPILQDPGYDENIVEGALKEKAGSIWATIATVIQVFAVACVVFAGLRYMFASSEQKADIKQGMIYLTIGSALVFGAVLIVRLVGTVGKDMLE